jgi:hypothetical protein
MSPVACLQKLWKKMENSENKDTREPDAVTQAEVGKKMILLRRK